MGSGGPDNLVHCNASHELHLERGRVRELLDAGTFFWLDVHEPGTERSRDPARRVRLPPALARGLLALRPAPEDRRLRRLCLPRRLRRLGRGRRGRPRRGPLLLLGSLPGHAAPRHRADDRRAPRALRQARRPRRRSRPPPAHRRRRPRRRLLPAPECDRRPDRRARRGDLPQGGRGGSPGDLRHEARARRDPEGRSRRSATCSRRSSAASRRSRA